jgi:hypothetical protein
MQPVRWKMILVITVASAAALIWQEHQPEPPPPEPIVVVPSGQLVKIEDFRSEWPFTINQGHADCISGRPVFRARGRIYALTGAARQLGYAPPDEIWRANPDIPGTRIPFQNITKIALEQCE